MDDADADPALTHCLLDFFYTAEHSTMAKSKNHTAHNQSKPCADASNFLMLLYTCGHAC